MKVMRLGVTPFSCKGGKAKRGNALVLLRHINAIFLWPSTRAAIVVVEDFTPCSLPPVPPPKRSFSSSVVVVVVGVVVVVVVVAHSGRPPPPPPLPQGPFS